MKQIPTIEHLNSCIEMKDGLFFWKERPEEQFSSRNVFFAWNTQHANKETLITRTFCLDGVTYNSGIIKFSLRMQEVMPYSPRFYEQVPDLLVTSYVYLKDDVMYWQHRSPCLCKNLNGDTWNRNFAHKEVRSTGTVIIDNKSYNFKRLKHFLLSGE